MEDALALSVLLRSGAPAAALRELLELHGDARNLLAAGPSAWRAAGLKPKVIARISLPDARLRELDARWLAGDRQRLLGWHSPDYPALLREAACPPAGLYVRGDVELLWQPQLAMVGSRRPSAGGRDNAHAFARAIATAGLVITSGLAVGIDAASHLGALERGRTIAVLGTGPDLCYPSCHRALLERIAANGALVTEHPPGTASHKSHFPSRNRLIAGLSLGTLVVEAALRSGALITARKAIDAGRDVFALPGSIHNPMARGCHGLIREGAALVEAPEEVLLALGPAAERMAAQLRGGSSGALAPGEPGVDCNSLAADGLAQAPGESDGSVELLIRALGHDPSNLDQLCRRTGLTVAALSAMLLSLELEGKITAEHGRYTRRC